MIKDKTIKVFDSEKIKQGYFITYCLTNAGENGKRVAGKPKNGIIYQVGDTYISFIVKDGETHRIVLENLLADKVRILGVKENALS